MSNFHFLKKDLEWKIVNLQCWGPHSPHNPTPHNGTLSSFKKETIHSCTLTSCAKRTHTHRHFCSPLSLSLLYSFKRENTPSWELRNEWQIEIWVATILDPLHHTHRFFGHYIFSLEQQLKRENYTPIHYYTPFLGDQKWVTNWDMSHKSF